MVTLLGVAGIRGSALEMKMIAGARDKALAFEAVEATLSLVESALKSEKLSLTAIPDQYTADCKAGTTGAAKGRCFTGSYDVADPYRTCSTYNADATSQAQLWENATLWKEEAYHAVQTIALSADVSIKTKYIVEFMCFTLKDRKLVGKVDDKETGDENIIYMPLFRITAIAEGVGKRARVAAQTTVIVSLNGA
jgi:type IV pilus assembly protein PilX